MVINIKGYDVLIDDDMLKAISRYSWCVTGRTEKNRVYFSARVSGQKMKLHRFIMNAPRGVCVDHISGNTLDNRRTNLRICSPAENSRNTGININNTTGYKGVLYNKRSKKYAATVRYNTQTIYLGTFKTAEDAAIAYNKKAKELYGEFYRELNYNIDETKYTGERLKYFKNELKGAYYNKKTKKYESYIAINKKSYFVGTFDTEKDAHLAYCNAKNNPEEFLYTRKKRIGVLLPGVTMNNRKNKYKSRIVVFKKCFWLGTFDTAEEAHAAYVKAKDNIAKGIFPNGARQ